MSGDDSDGEDWDANIRNLLDIEFDTRYVETETEDGEFILEGVDETEVDKFLRVGCGCQRNCIDLFAKETISESHDACREMKYYCSEHIKHHHLFLMGKQLIVVMLW